MKTCKGPEPSFQTDNSLVLSGQIDAGAVGEGYGASQNAANIRTKIRYTRGIETVVSGAISASVGTEECIDKDYNSQYFHAALEKLISLQVDLLIVSLYSVPDRFVDQCFIAGIIVLSVSPDLLDPMAALCGCVATQDFLSTPYAFSRRGENHQLTLMRAGHSDRRMQGESVSWY